MKWNSEQQRCEGHGYPDYGVQLYSEEIYRYTHRRPTQTLQSTPPPLRVTPTAGNITPTRTLTPTLAPTVVIKPALVIADSETPSFAPSMLPTAPQNGTLVPSIASGLNIYSNAPSQESQDWMSFLNAVAPGSDVRKIFSPPKYVPSIGNMVKDVLNNFGQLYIGVKGLGDAYSGQKILNAVGRGLESVGPSGDVIPFGIPVVNGDPFWWIY